MLNNAQTSPRHVFEPDVLDEIGLDDGEFAAKFGLPHASAEVAVTVVADEAMRPTIAVPMRAERVA